MMALSLGSRVVIDDITSRPELNGRKGRIVAWDAEQPRCGVLVDGEQQRLSLKKVNLRPATTDPEYATAIRHLAPRSIEALLDDVIGRTEIDWHTHVEDCRKLACESECSMGLLRLL